MKTFLSFISEASERNPQDSVGKLHETLVGKYLNNNKFSEHHRTDEGTPEQVHNRHAKALFGDDYHNHPRYKRMDDNAKKAASDIKEHIKKHGITEIKRVAWTSQPSDHHKETGVHDPNSTADVIVTGHNKKQVGVSLKVGKTETPNYKNPGVESYEKMANVKLKHLNKDHSAVLEKHGSPSHEQYKAMRDSNDSKEKAKATEIKHSSDLMNKSMAKEIHSGLSKMSHDQLHSVIKTSTSPQTHLPTVVSHTVNKDDHTLVSHEVHDQDHHVTSYLNKFKDLHVKPHTGGTSITIKGTHKETGKVMPVWHTTVYAGGRPANKSPRGAITLPSENKVK